MKIKSLNWFVDKEKGQTCLLLGSAPNMYDFPFDKFKGKIITFGDSMIRGENLFKSDYYIGANDFFPVPDIPIHLEMINSFRETVFLLADSVIYSHYYDKKPGFLEENLKVDWLLYDQRHFLGKECTPRARCCNLLSEKDREMTIQEFVSGMFGKKAHYSVASTVAIHALALALIMGCNPIIFQGVELPIVKKKVWHPNEKADKMLKDTLDYVVDNSGASYLQKKLKKLPEDVKAFLKNLNSPKELLSLRSRSVFSSDIAEIMCDFQFLVDIASDFQRDVYVLSKTSSLNYVAGVSYADDQKLSELIR